MNRLPRKLLALFSLSLAAQTTPINLDFREIAIEGKPPGWSWSGDPSYSVTVVDECRTLSTRCVLFHSPTDRVPGGSGMFLQSFDASAYRGERVRYRAWVRQEAPSPRGAQLFLRVDRPAGAGFRGDSPSKKPGSTDWVLHEVEGTIDPDAKRITIGLTLNGPGAAVIADLEFDAVSP